MIHFSINDIAIWNTDAIFTRKDL